MTDFRTPAGEPRAFVVVSSSRSGSNLLVSYIRQVAAAASFGEIFRDDFPGMTAWAKLSKRLDLPDEAGELHATDVTRFWELVLSRILERRRWAGAKAFYYHRRDDRIWARFGSDDHRVIHLWRDSVFDQYVSRLRAFASGEWKSTGGVSGAGAEEPVTFDREDYLEFRTTRLRDIEATRERYRSSDHYVEVEYAQLSDHQRMAALLETWFGERVDIEERLERQSSRPSLEYLANPEVARPFEADTISGGFPAA